MIHIIASNSDRYPTSAGCTIKTTWSGQPETLFFARGMFDHEDVAFVSLKVEILDEEKSKSFLGSAGASLLGAAVLGPVGLFAGLLTGGNKQTGVFGLTFTNVDNQEVKLVVKTSNKLEVSQLKQKAFGNLVANK